MTVSLTDKRRKSERINGIELSNGAWFSILSINGMSELVNTQKTNDPMNVSPAKSKKMAELIVSNTFSTEAYRPLNLHILICLIDFLKNCNGFRSS